MRTACNPLKIMCRYYLQNTLIIFYSVIDKDELYCNLSNNKKKLNGDFMKNILAMILIIGIISCTDEKGTTTKPISGQIPSDNKLVLEGTPITNNVSIATVPTSAVDGIETTDAIEYNLLDRLYDTVWFQSEEDIDDGVVEVETEFLFFKKIGSTVRLDEVEMENGIIDPPDGDNEYSELTEIDNTVDTATLNAFVAKNIEFENGHIDDAEYEGYYLKDNRTLYVIDDDTAQQVKTKLQAMIQLTDAQLELHYNDDRYLLSEKPVVDVVPNTPAP